MTRKRLIVDVLLVGVLILAGILLYPWGQRQYYLWLLASPNPDQALDARDALTRIGSPAVPALSEVIRGEVRSDKRIMAFEALTQIEDERVLPVVLEVAAADWDQELQGAALQLLERGNIREAAPIFERLLTDVDPRIRFDAVRGVLATGKGDPLPLLIARLDDPDLMVAAAAARALSQVTGQPRPFPSGSTEEARAARAATTAAWKAWYAEQVGGAPQPIPAAATMSGERAVGPEAPDFLLPALDGTTVRLSSFRGKPVLVNFWATWCPPCIRETGDLVKTAQALGTDAVVLGVTAEDKNNEPAERELRRRGEPITPATLVQIQTEAVQAFIQEHGIPYPVMFGDTATLDAYNAYALPTTVIIRPDGTIHRRVIGERSKEFFVAALREAGQ